MEEAVENKMGKKEFWLRFSLWIIFGVVAPVVFLAVKYDLFATGDSVETANAKITGWGVLAIIIMALFVMGLAKEALNGLPKGSLTRQCISGFLKLVPLIMLILVIEATKNTMARLEEFLIFLAICEAVAVPLNPMPKWAAQNQVDINENLITRSLKSAIDYYRKGGK